MFGQKKILSITDPSSMHTSILDYLTDTTVCHLFEQQVAKTPHSIALVCQEEQMTYQELNERANQLAHCLIKKGITEETPIGICVERSFDLVIGILGILKAGGAYVPFEPTLPKERIEYILSNCQAKIILSQSFLWDEKNTILPQKCDIVFLDQLLSVLSQEKKSNVNLAKPNQLIYIIYTSGSTGEPKGVLIEHRNVSRLFFSTENIYHFNSNDIWTLFHAFHFDFSVWEMWGALLYGGKLIVISKSLTKELEEFYHLLINEKVTILNLTPSVFYKLIKIDERYKKKLSLRNIILGGESLSFKALTSWFQHHEDKQPTIVNMYGITETTIFSTYYIVTKDISINSQQSIIGKPLADRPMYILNSEQSPVSVNEPGEIYTSGGGIARGYLNNKQMTEDRFLINPFRSALDPSERIYKTGDMGRWLPDGTIEYIGRTDDQIKIRGFRVELGEIQSQIERFPGIEQAIVIAQANELNEKKLIGYFLEIPGIRVDINLLREFLESFLPYYMIPSLFVCISEVPLTSNGKVDKHRLPDPNKSQLIRSNYIPPQTQEEKQIAAIWSQILHVSPIGIYDNFFELGGDSLSSLEVIAQIRIKCGVDVPLQIFLKHNTLTKLASIISSLSPETGHSFPVEKNYSKKSYLPSCLVPLQTKGKKTPLFLIHPVGGTVFWYIPIAKYLDNDYPLYGIQDPGIELGNIPFNSIQEMASFYIREIQTIQPHGPYFIGGASAGANTSIEIAYQLQAKGEQVAFIALLDGFAPLPNSTLNYEAIEKNMYNKYIATQEQFFGKNIKEAEHLLLLQKNRLNLLANYYPPILNNKLTLFKAKDNSSGLFHSLDAPLNHWENYSTRSIELHMVPGNHETMFQYPYALLLADKLNECLNRATTFKRKNELHISTVKFQ